METIWGGSLGSVVGKTKLMEKSVKWLESCEEYTGGGNFSLADNNVISAKKYGWGV